MSNAKQIKLCRKEGKKLLDLRTVINEIGPNPTTWQGVVQDLYWYVRQPLAVRFYRAMHGADGKSDLDATKKGAIELVSWRLRNLERKNFIKYYERNNEGWIKVTKRARRKLGGFHGHKVIR